MTNPTLLIQEVNQLSYNSLTYSQLTNYKMFHTMGVTFLYHCCRHPITGAATDAWHQQEDGRGAEGHLRLLGEGATASRRAQR